MTTIITPITGGCTCGKIRYESTSGPVAMLHCHCLDCQKWSGGPFSSYTVVPKENFRLTEGTLKFYATESEAGGKNHRGFCEECGSPVVSEPDSALAITAIMTGSLDDPGGFTPQMEVWVSDAQPWDQISSAAAKFEKYPVAK